MASVQDFKECPKCKFGEAITNFYCRTQEYNLFCPRCGYTYEIVLKRRSRDKMPVIKNGKCQYKAIEKIGYGSFRLCDKDGFGKMGVLSEPMNDEIKWSFEQSYKGEDINKEESYLTSFNPETGEIVAVFGKVPIEQFTEDSDTGGEATNDEAQKAASL